MLPPPFPALANTWATFSSSRFCFAPDSLWRLCYALLCPQQLFSFPVILLTDFRQGFALTLLNGAATYYSIWQLLLMPLLLPCATLFLVFLCCLCAQRATPAIIYSTVDDLSNTLLIYPWCYYPYFCSCWVVLKCDFFIWLSLFGCFLLLSDCDVECYKYFVLSCSSILAIWSYCSCFFGDCIWPFWCSYCSNITGRVWQTASARVLSDRSFINSYILFRYKITSLHRPWY